jgi:hypothetical protein
MTGTLSAAQSREHFRAEFCDLIAYGRCRDPGTWMRTFNASAPGPTAPAG